MAITSWTSEGMDWSDPEKLKLNPPYVYMEAIRLALLERMKAKGPFQVFPVPGYFPTDLRLAFLGASDTNGMEPTVNSGFPAQVDYLLWNQQGTPGYSFPQYFSRIDQMTFPSDALPERWTIADMLTYLGEEKIELDHLGVNIAEWACQRYRLINLLRYGASVFYNSRTEQEKIWFANGTILDWRASTYGFMDALKASNSRRTRQSFTEIGLAGDLLKRQMMIGKVSGCSPKGDFDTCGNVDASGNVLQLGKYQMLTDSGFTAATAITSTYNDINSDPGHQSSYAGWSILNADRVVLHEYEFNFRNW